MYNCFNDTKISINEKTTSSVGASIFYDFFGTGIMASGLIYGSPGTSFGSGYANANRTYVQDSELDKASAPYYLYNVLKIQGSLYSTS